MFYFFILVSVISITKADPAQMSSPLLLTPYIERDNIEEARQASSVNPDIFLNVTSYSGFLTVDKRYNSNLFFWYFPNVAKNVTQTPWIIWLQGGPGGTSLVGLFGEMGPFEYVNDTLKLREYSWCSEYSMVFIDNPVGAGFSFTDYEDGYSKNMDMYTNNLYNAVKQLTSLYPELGHAPLYIAGESYAGRYVPALAAKIAEGRYTDNSINLQGIMLGNPVLDRKSLLDYTRVFYHWGLIDSQGALAVEPLQEDFEQAVNSGDVEKANKLHDEIFTKLNEISNHDEFYNVLSDVDITLGIKKFIPHIEKAAIRQAIHVGYQPFSFVNRKKTQRYLSGDYLAAVSKKVEMLLENYKVLIYCGQLDLTTPCVLNAEGRRKRWQWSGRDSFLKAQRYPWWFNNTVAGYVKSGGNFTEVLVTRAGHMVPIDRPAETKLLVSSFIRGVDLNKPPAFQRHEEVSYEEEDLNHRTSPDYKTGLVVSIVVNVLLVIGIFLGVLIFVKWRRHYDIVPFSDSVLSLT